MLTTIEFNVHTIACIHVSTLKLLFQWLIDRYSSYSKQSIIIPCILSSTTLW